MKQQKEKGRRQTYFLISLLLAILGTVQISFEKQGCLPRNIPNAQLQNQRYRYNL